MSVFEANWNHYCMIDSAVMRELLKFAPWPLKNCEFCAVIHRADTWCTCPDAEKARAEFESAPPTTAIGKGIGQ